MNVPLMTSKFRFMKSFVWIEPDGKKLQVYTDSSAGIYVLFGLVKGSLGAMAGGRLQELRRATPSHRATFRENRSPKWHYRQRQLIFEFMFNFYFIAGANTDENVFGTEFLFQMFPRKKQQIQSSLNCLQSGPRNLAKLSFRD